jgi:hypothetical protein
VTEDDPRHGTNKGYAAHLVHGIPACSPCRKAHARAVRRWEYLTRSGRSLSAPTVGVRRRIQALCRLGWTYQQIADACGWRDGAQVAQLLERGECHATTHRRVAAAYDQLSMTLPAPSGWATRMQRRAEQNGWLPPLAWDDETIDNPVHSPAESVDLTNEFNIDEVVVLRVLAGEHLPTTRPEREEIVRRWMANGGSQRTICTRMGWKQGRYTQAPLNASREVVGKPGNDESSAQRKAS